MLSDDGGLRMFADEEAVDSDRCQHIDNESKDCGRAAAYLLMFRYTSEFDRSVFHDPSLVTVMCDPHSQYWRAYFLASDRFNLISFRSWSQP